MLKKFLLNSLSSFVGAWLAIMLFIIGAVVFVLGLVGSAFSTNVEKLEKHSVLRIYLGGDIEETETTPELDMAALMSGKLETPQSLKEILQAIEAASSNSNIDALLLECGCVSASPATLNAISESVLNFKKSGKRVFAYGDSFTTGDYLVATSADVIYLNPAGTINLQGLNGTSIYFKELLDKIGVEVQTVRVGSFKSAIEPFTSNSMSDAARLQLEELYTEMWDYITGIITKDRQISADTINSLVNNYIYLQDAAEFKKFKFVDDCLYYRQVEDLIGEYVGKDVKDINYVKSSTLVNTIAPQTPDANNQIAVVYAVGEIGEFYGAGIDCHKYVPLIVKLANDDKVKALVLRVNSPGGSVFGSEQIGEALDYFKSKGKPVVVSMGDYAASGGYWISANADYIYADPLTVTGSIGIFGMVPNVGGLAKKIGITPQTVGTNPNAVFPSIFYPMSESQQAALQKNVERGYEKFIDRVAAGRGKSPEYIKTIAEGRVWNAIKAKELGLVDGLGGLQDGIDKAADMANVSNHKVVFYPEQEPNFLQLMAASAAGQNEAVKALIDKLENENTEAVVVNLIRWLLGQEDVQARSPYYKLSL